MGTAPDLAVRERTPPKPDPVRVLVVDDSPTVRAVFHGHAHHGTYEGATTRGIPVFNTAAQIAKPDGKPYALLEV